ncbi:type II toxin-antitoxin system VapC family toxin [Nonomuraea sp. RK-328]|nr:type II toxin-antitoxin system VapC family toxin [Nonomuraea sp. RK-328]
MPDRHPRGVIDTCVYIDLAELSPDALPEVPELTTLTLAELHQGVAMAKTAAARAARVEKLGAAVVDFEPLAFDADAAARYGSLVALTIEAKRDPRPRRVDLMIAAIASSRGLPLYTRNTDVFVGLEGLVALVPV